MDTSRDPENLAATRTMSITRSGLVLSTLLAAAHSLHVASRRPSRCGEPHCCAGAPPPWASASALLGFWELEELEDSESCKTLITLNADGTLGLGATSGPPPISCEGSSWMASSASSDVQMEISLVRRYAIPGSVTNIFAEPSEQDSYVTMRTLRGYVSDGNVPGTFSLIGELDMATCEVVAPVEPDACDVPDDTDVRDVLARVGHFTMVKIPEEEPHAAGVAAGASDEPYSRHKSIYTQGETDAQRRSLADRFGRDPSY